MAFYENLVKLYQELIQGEASGLSQLQVDQVMSQLIGARQQLFIDKVTYRTALDQFKMQMGLPPDLPIVMDQSSWGRRSTRSSTRSTTGRSGRTGTSTSSPGSSARSRSSRTSTSMAARSWDLPELSGHAKSFVPEDEDGLEDLLQAAVRIAMEYRLDLMNARAPLYDAWRQIRVTANTLKGVLNVALTNNVYTRAVHHQPVRLPEPGQELQPRPQRRAPAGADVNERNAFRTALINYQRARRTLMSAEDNLKIQLTERLTRRAPVAYINYEINKRNYELNVRLKDQAFEQIVAPPAGGRQRPGPVGQRRHPDDQPAELPERGVSARRLSLING